MKNNRTTVIYPGSFDPPTFGHMNIVERALTIFDKVIVSVATNTTKNCLFSPEERLALLKKIYKNKKQIEVDHFHGLLVDYAKRKKCRTILRGLRTVADYEYELQMAFSNKSIYPNIETIFLMTENRFSHLSSTLIKEIFHFGGPTKNLVPPMVEKMIRSKINKMRGKK
jgi:pantetheine-phosphate adenylyltransferase